MKTYDYHHLNHVKEQQSSKKTLWITLLLTLVFTVVEIVGGLLSNSLALLSDSAHMISDVLALGLSLTASYLATRHPNRKYTFGFLRFEIIASFLNGLALVVIAIGIFIEGIHRLIQPRDIHMQLMLMIAAVGLLVNIVLTIILSRSSKEEENLNIKSALWHFMGDLLSSVGIIASSVLIYFTGYSIFDPLISMIIGGIIFYGGAKIIRESFLILMEAVPDKFDLDSIRQEISKVEGVKDVHELHLWAVSTDHYSLTAHVFIQEDVQPFEVIQAINHILKEKYGIQHSTIQTEHPAIHDHGDYGKQFIMTKC
ncbi:cation diffusion facilitator family transporter [Polycladomyces subterraneus]|uniref:Cation diffusion facilitator family transporter n=1 Tax=Polycladomyces subterraneus TaxID=1016997 RepID=A0ABT8IRD8_9BACL|nr:cation diffusion facilitator family transporter [Polycladomyces subterraneus]MDN4595374.1 cation diffusion facilitator family transporter [Polycladomyces subterraneus]